MGCLHRPGNAGWNSHSEQSLEKRRRMKTSDPTHFDELSQKPDFLSFHLTRRSKGLLKNNFR
jgi:hypothetical protein